MENHKPWTITAKSSSEIEILLYDMIGQDWLTGDGITAKSFAEDLRAAGKVSTIHLRVNSPGGNVFDGLAIFNSLLTHGAKITAQVDGLAASIASVILMAASEISMGENTFLMLHNPSTMIGGDAPRMRKMADTLDKVKSSMITAYQRHTTKSVEEIGAILDAESWLTAQEAVDNGFAENVTTTEEDEADIAANFDLSHFRKVPAQIAAVFGRQPRPPFFARRPGDGISRTKRLAVLRQHEVELDALAKTRTSAERAAVLRQHQFELDALARKVRAAELRQHTVELAKLDREIEFLESTKPKTDAQRFAVLRQRAINLGIKPYISARHRYPGMS